MKNPLIKEEKQNQRDVKSDPIIVQIPVEKLRGSRFQTRLSFFSREEDTQELAESIRQNGLLEIPIAHKHPAEKDCFEIISGHRRLEAISRILGWKTVPCKIIETKDDKETVKLVLANNVERSKLHPYEEGIVFYLTKRKLGLVTVKEVAEFFNRPPNDVRIKLELAEQAWRCENLLEKPRSDDFIRNLTSAHAHYLSQLPDGPELLKASEMIAEGKSLQEIQNPGRENKSKSIAIAKLEPILCPNCTNALNQLLSKSSRPAN